jgi:hypothetical protein
MDQSALAAALSRISIGKSMPSRVAQFLNKPIRTVVDVAEINGGNLRYAALNIPISQGMKLLFRGIIAAIRLDNAADVNVNNRFGIFGFEGVEIDNTRSNLIAFFDESKLTHFYQQDFGTRVLRVPDFFNHTIELSSAGVYSFGAGLVQAGGVFANGLQVDLTVMGEVVRADMKKFPLEYR